MSEQYKQLTDGQINSLIAKAMGYEVVHREETCRGWVREQEWVPGYVLTYPRCFHYSGEVGFDTEEEAWTSIPEFSQNWDDTWPILEHANSSSKRYSESFCRAICEVWLTWKGIEANTEAP